MIKIKIEDVRTMLKGKLQKMVFDYLIENDVGSVAIISNKLDVENITVYKALKSFIEKGIATREKKMNTWFYKLNKEVEL